VIVMRRQSPKCRDAPSFRIARSKITSRVSLISSSIAWLAAATSRARNASTMCA